MDKIIQNFYDGFVEHYEELTKINSNPEYIEDYNNANNFSLEIIEKLSSIMERKEAIHLVESLSDSYHSIMFLRDCATFEFAFLLGVKTGIKVNDININ